MGGDRNTSQAQKSHRWGGGISGDGIYKGDLTD